MTCAEAEGPQDAEAFAAFAAERERLVPHFGALRAYQTSPCLSWPGEPGEQRPGPFTPETAEPVLIVSKQFDPATPVWSAKRLHDALPHSHLLVDEGWGHIATQQSGCVVNAVSAYLLGDGLPPEGARCTPDQVPFS